MVLSRSRFETNIVQVFTPSAGTWEVIWGGFNNNVRKSLGAASSSGNLYVFSKQHVMTYDCENNVWTLVASLPQKSYFITCVTEWPHDCIFLTAYAVAHKKHIFYLFNPSTGRWIQVNGDEEGFVGMVVSATTLEI